MANFLHIIDYQIFEFTGPHIYALYEKDDETHLHLFHKSKFTFDVWAQIYSHVDLFLDPNDAWKDGA